MLIWIPDVLDAFLEAGDRTYPRIPSAEIIAQEDRENYKKVDPRPTSKRQRTN